MTVPSIKELKQYYKKQQFKSCIQLYQGDYNQIVLIRHGEPDLLKLKRYTREKAIAYSVKYDEVGVKIFSKKPLCTDVLDVKKVYHSDLPRATHTAELLFGNNFNLLPDNRFREFEKSIFRFLDFPMPLKFWTFLSRIFWFLGINSAEVESVKEAKNRARDNARFLAKKAQQEKTVLLVAHGWHNRYIMKYLKNKKWDVVYNEGDKYLSIKILAKEKN